MTRLRAMQRYCQWLAVGILTQTGTTRSLNRQPPRARTDASSKRCGGRSTYAFELGGVVAIAPTRVVRSLLGWTCKVPAAIWCL